MSPLTTKNAIAIFSFVIGLFMIAFWSALVLTNQILPEQIPWAISFHLAGEFATAILLMLSGVGLLLTKSWVRILSPFTLGMLLYTVIVSPGYYAQLGNTPMVVMFLVLIAFTIAALAGTFKIIKNTMD